MKNLDELGFCEINEKDLMMVDGGFWSAVWEIFESFCEGFADGYRKTAIFTY